jgi:hypothetical protein
VASKAYNEMRRQGRLLKMYKSKIEHEPTCRADYPEKTRGEAPRATTDVPIWGNEVARTCNDCGAFEIIKKRLMLQITSPYFCAGIVQGGPVAPIIWYMKGWTLGEIKAYCAKKGWTIERSYVMPDCQVAQTVEHRSEEPGVGGSTPPLATK